MLEIGPPVVNMSLKQDIEKWSEGVVLAENQDFSNAEKTLLEISESSARICFCLASCALKQGKMYLVGRVRLLKLAVDYSLGVSLGRREMRERY